MSARWERARTFARPAATFSLVSPWILRISFQNYVGIFLNIFTVDLWENFFFDFLEPIKQALALNTYDMFHRHVNVSPYCSSFHNHNNSSFNSTLRYECDGTFSDECEFAARAEGEWCNHNCQENVPSDSYRTKFYITRCENAVLRTLRVRKLHPRPRPLGLGRGFMLHFYTSSERIARLASCIEPYFSL